MSRTISQSQIVSVAGPPGGSKPTTLHLALPKGRMYDGVVALLAAAGIGVGRSDRGYRPRIGLEAVECKVLKPRAIVEMLSIGRRDVGFAGADWVAEAKASGEGFEPPVPMLDTGLDPVRLVAAAPPALLEEGRLPDRGDGGRELVVASEYAALTRRWIAERGLRASVLRSYGATEVLPPEDADLIVDNVATGSTLAANGLAAFDELMRSSTWLYASPRSLDIPDVRRRIEDLTVLLRSVLEARRRVLVEVNVSADRLSAVVGVLPCMREPTVSPLHGQGGYAVKAAVPRERLAETVGLLREAGGTDVIVTNPQQIVA